MMVQFNYKDWLVCKWEFLLPYSLTQMVYWAKILHMAFETGEQAEQRARQGNPALDAALTRVEDEKRQYLEPIVEYFGRLEAEILGMPIAKRFRTDQTPNHMFAPGGEKSVLPHLVGLSEAEYKRAQLLADVRSLRAEAMILIGGVETVVMDMEATKVEG
jgi:hypothetical protein